MMTLQGMADHRFTKKNRKLAYLRLSLPLNAKNCYGLFEVLWKGLAAGCHSKKRNCKKWKDKQKREEGNNKETDSNFILINILNFPNKGERHGLVVSIEACRSKGRGFKSPHRLSLLKNVSCRGNKECIVRGRRRRRRSRTCKTRSGIETCKTRRSRQTAKAIKSGMVTREMVWFVSKTIKWLTPSKVRHGEKN